MAASQGVDTKFQPPKLSTTIHVAGSKQKQRTGYHNTVVKHRDVADGLGELR